MLFSYLFSLVGEKDLQGDFPGSLVMKSSCWAGCVMACFQARGLGWAIRASGMNGVWGQVAREKLWNCRVSGNGSALSKAPFSSLPTWSPLHLSECPCVESHPRRSRTLTRPTSGRSGS